MTRESNRAAGPSLAAPFLRAAVALALGVTLGALALAAVRRPCDEPAPTGAIAAQNGRGETAPESLAGRAAVPDALPRRARLVLPDGLAPAAGAAVLIFDPARPGAGRERHVTDASGHFSWPEGRGAAAFSPGAGFAIAGPRDEAEGSPGGGGPDLVLAPGTAIRGVVTDALARPVPRARVAIAFEEPLRPFRAAAVCDPAGRFEIAGLPFGTARIAATARAEFRGAAEPVGRRVFLSPSRVADVSLVADDGPRSRSPRRAAAAPETGEAARPERRTLRGVAIDDTGSPAPGVRVALEDEAAGVWAETVTDAAGRFVFRTAPLGGRARVEALGAAFEGSLEGDAPPPGAALVLPLTRLGALSGRIECAELEDGERLLVLLEPEDGGEPIVVTLLARARDDGRNGEFLAAGLRPGRYAASLVARGRVVWHSPEVVVEAGATTDLPPLVAADVPLADDDDGPPPAEERPLTAD